MKQQLITTLLALCITFPLNIFPQSNLPSKKERIYSLSMIWKELEYNFAFPSYFQKQSNKIDCFPYHLPFSLRI